MIFNGILCAVTQLQNSYAERDEEKFFPENVGADCLLTTGKKSAIMSLDNFPFL